MSSERKNERTRVTKVGAENKEYVVEKILLRRKRNRKVQYFLKWKGFDESENSWESAEKLNCKHLIELFEAQRAKKFMKAKANIDPERTFSLRTRNTLNSQTVDGAAAKPTLEESETDKENSEEIKESSKKSSKYNTEQDVIRKNEEKQKSPTRQTVAAEVPDISTTTVETEVRENSPALINEPKIPPIKSIENSKSYELINDKILVSDFLTRPSVQTGFQKGLEVERILGATNVEGRLYLILKFHGDDEPQPIEAVIVNRKIPQMVIKFYEDSVFWYSDDDDDER